MAKFRKKPVVIEAEQWNGQPIEDLEIMEGGVGQGLYFETYGVIQTLEGPHIAKLGDWIITGIKGEKYPCKPDIFEATYEPLEGE